MKHIYITGVALLALASLPLAAQRTTKVHLAPAAPEVAEFDGSSPRSYLGVGVSDLTNDRVQALKLKDDRGVEVTQVDQDAPAGKAGLKEHDVIVGFNGTPVESGEQFKRLMRETPPGRTVSLDLIRDGQQQNVKVQLADRKKLESSVWPHAPHAPDENSFAMPPMPPMPAMPSMPAMPAIPRGWTEQTIVRVHSNSGATLESLTPQLGDFFGVKNGEGLLVRSVQKGTPADAAGLRAGDVVVRVGDQKIADNSDWNEALRNAKGSKVPVVVMRDKKEQTLSMSVPLRKGPDSSALSEDAVPEMENAMEAAASAIDQAEPLLEENVTGNLNNAAQTLACNRERINEAMKQAMETLHRNLIDNRKQVNRSLAESMKIASEQLKFNSADVEKAMREAQRALEGLHIGFSSEMQ